MTQHCLFFAAPVNQQSANAFISYLIDLQLTGATELTIAMSSPGGNVVNGFTIYNSILSMNYQIATHNIGNVDSIANIIFLAGGRRIVNSTSTFMFHSVGFDGNATERLEEKNLLQKLDVIRADHKRISSVIGQKSNLSERQTLNLFKEQATKDATWAVNAGIADAISEFKIPAHRNIKYLV